MRERFLDGLRGWAALFVVAHHAGPCFLWLDWRVGPVVPIFTDGTLAVFVFFVLSGYVLSAQFYRDGGRAGVVDLALRRYPRLGLPVLSACSLAFIVMVSGAMFNIQASVPSGSEWLGSFFRFAPSLLDLLRSALFGVFVDMKDSKYDPVLWTMYYEMVGSILIFVMLLVSGRTTALRLLGHLIFLGLTWWLQSPLFALAAGSALAQIVASSVHKSFQLTTTGQIVGGAALLLGLSFAAFRPSLTEQMPLALCSVGVVYGALVSSWVKSLLETPLSQWLGKISFSLYLVHLLVICSFGAWLYLRVGGGAKLSEFEVSAVFIAIGAVSLLAARIFQPVDRAGVLLGRHFSSWVLRNTRPASEPAPARR